MPFRTEKDKVAQPGQSVPSTFRAQPQGKPRNLSDLITGERHVSTPMDMLRGAYTGVSDGVRGLADLGGLAFGTGNGPNRQIGDAMIELLRQKHPVAAEAIHPRYQPQTVPGQYARTLASMLPNAVLGGGGLAARAAQVVVPGLLSETAGQVTKGTPLEQPARIAGAVVGGGLSALRRPQSAVDQLNGLTRAEAKGARALIPARGAADRIVGQIQTNAERYRNAGIAPTVADVVDDSARGLLRQTASRATPARQAVRDFADGRAANLPDRMSQQARRVMSSDPRTPDEIVGELSARRSVEADQQFGAVRGETFPLTAEGADALQTQRGLAAIRDAASRETDPAVRAALHDLHTAAPAAGQQVSVAVADRISRVLGGLGEAAGRSGDNDLARTYGVLGNAVRGPARQAIPGYDAALNNYAASSELMDAARTGEGFMARNTDEFAAAVSDMTPEQQAVARAAARRAVERASGENVSAAPGVARRLSLAPEQQARNAALLGPQDASTLQNNMGLEAMAVRNAQDINPRAGSPTSLNNQDAARGVGEAVSTAVGALHGSPHAIVGAARIWLKSRGLNDAEAEQLSNMAIDPGRTDQVIGYLQSRLGADAAEQYRRSLAATRTLTPIAPASEQSQ